MVQNDMDIMEVYRSPIIVNWTDGEVIFVGAHPQQLHNTEQYLEVHIWRGHMSFHYLCLLEGHCLLHGSQLQQHSLR
jgi:hypothetical protein